MSSDADLSQQPESSHAFMNAFLDSQMFERFLEERTGNATQPEVRFFDESIAAKLNRSKTNPIKKDTPFLNDLSDAHNQVMRWFLDTTDWVCVGEGAMVRLGCMIETECGVIETETRRNTGTRILISYTA